MPPAVSSATPSSTRVHLEDSHLGSPANNDGARASGRASGLFYGWLMVALTTLVLVASSPGQTYGFTYFNPCLRNALGLSQTELSAMYLLATLSRTSD